MKRFSDIVYVKDCVGSNKGNTVVGIVNKVENVTLPSGKTLFTRFEVGRNTMLVGGTQHLAQHLTGLTTGVKIHTLDEELKSVITPTQAVTKESQIVCAIGLSNGGAEGAVVYEVPRYGCGFKKSSLIPFRMVPSANDDPQTFYADYCCRTVENGNAVYYLKKIKNLETYSRTIETQTRLEDRPDLGLSGNTAVETVIVSTFSITLEDLAEYYASLGDTTRRKFSTISLFIGNTVSVSLSGQTCVDHRKLMVTNQLNVEEEYLKANKSADYEYTVHFR